MLSHPKRSGWEVVNGALDADETVLDGVLREIAEEAGPRVRVRPLGAIHIASFHFDSKVQYMISLHYLLEYLGGQVEPGDDMQGSEYRWWPVDELMSDHVDVLVPVESKWVLQRALDLFRLWGNEGAPDLQPDLSIPRRNKYEV